MTFSSAIDTNALFQIIRRAANNNDRVSGLTHRHYKYPARFSPKFVAAALGALTKPGDIVLDPYMGGGTTIVEATSINRRAIGCDLNSLAVFVAKVKTARLSAREEAAIVHWSLDVVPALSYRSLLSGADEVFSDARTRNLDLPRARAIRKFIALALLSVEELPSKSAENFARCVLLNAAQWALNGRKSQVDLPSFRQRVTTTALEMLVSAGEYKKTLDVFNGNKHKPVLIHGSTENIADDQCWRGGTLADIVVTSPPYPGVHVLYHRWQVDGRKETPAPYWIVNKLDGQGAAYYNFGERKSADQDDYFAASLRTLCGIRSVMKDDAPIIQVLAFSDPKTQLLRYLENMKTAGFTEVRPEGKRYHRIWRHVPGRSWHAQLQGHTNSAREIVLIHTAA